MIDLSTGKFTLREGVELYPGMTRDEFYLTSLFQTELYRESDKDDPGNRSYYFKPQTVDGYEMSVEVFLSDHNYVTEIELTRPDFYDWPNWPQDISEADYAYSIKKYNDDFLENQIKKSIGEGDEASFDYDWGSITSSINLRHTPNVKITLRYREAPFLKAKGITFDHIDVFGNGNQ